MKRTLLISALILIALTLNLRLDAQVFGKKKADKTDAGSKLPHFTNNLDSVSYILGADIAKNLEKNEIGVNREMFFRGFSDHQSQCDTAISEAEIMKVMTAWQSELGSRKQKAAEGRSSENLKAGEAFLAENAKKEGVVVTPSGLQYKVITEGSGASPKDGDEVKVDYTGTLIDGTVFDSSRERGEPVEFPINRVIPGWTEALKMMKVGSRYMLYIPANLGYGNRAMGSIPEGSTLIFDVELLEFEHK